MPEADSESVPVRLRSLDAYRGFVLGIAERVAHAHKTGGFLGFGGKKVSDAEAAAIEEIRRTLNL